MSWLRRLFGGSRSEGEKGPTRTDADFLAGLSRQGKVKVSNLNPLIYQCILKEKSGEDAPAMIGDEAAFALLRKLSVAELERLQQSVECGQKADRAGSDMRRAAALYKKAAELNPYNSLALLSYGVALANLGDLRKGIKSVKQALKVDPGNERIRSNLKGMKADL